MEAAAAEPASIDRGAVARSHETAVLQPSAGPGFDPSIDRFVLGSPADPPDAAARALSAGGPKTPILQRAQRCYGNRTSQQIVMRAHVLQRKCDCGGTCEKCQEEDEQRAVQRQATGANLDAFEGIPSTAGEPLADGHRDPLESHFQADLSDVRVHTSAEAAQSARSLNALAYTSGRDIYFASGMYAPASHSGRQLLAHEVAHVVQQGAGKEPSIAAKSAHGVKIGAPDDSLEMDADRAAQEFMNGSQPQLTDEEQRRRREAAPVQRFIQRQPATPNVPPAPVTPVDTNKPVRPPDPKGDLVVNTDTNVTFTGNVEYVRYQLQNFVALNGTSRLGIFLTGFYRFGSGLGPFLDKPPEPATPERNAYFERVVNLVRSEAKSLKLKLDEFISDFERRAVDKLNEMLDASKAKVEEERKRYDVKKEDSGHSVETGNETADLTRRSRDLLAKQAAVVSAKSELERAQPFGPHGELPPGGAPEQKDQDAETAARNKYNDAQRAYGLARDEAERRHPILVSYQLDPLGPTTAETLGKLGSTSSSVQADTLAGEIDNKLGNIEKVRNDVRDDHSKVWNLSAVVEATKTYPDIKNYRGLSPAVTGTLLAEKAGAIRADAELTGLFTGLALLIIGLIAAIPTGGLSLGGAAVVATAGVAEAGLMAFTAYQATEKYRFDAAASGTDFDKAKAISQEEPSLFWLALDIVGALVALPKGLSAFRTLVGLRRTAIAAKAAGQLSEAEKLLNTLESEGEDIKKGVGSTLKKEAEDLAAARVKHAPEFEEIQNNLAKKRPSTVPGYTEEIPLDGPGDHFWRKSSNGSWCRFSADPMFCFNVGTTEGSALEEQLLEFEGEQTSRDTLRDNIIRSGAPLPPGGNWQAHHIVPWQLRDHPVVVFVREKFGWSMNSVENGVPLATKADPAGALAGKVATHSGSHAAYTSEVANDLDLLQERWNDFSPNQTYSEFQKILDQNRARMIRDLGGAPVR